MGYSTASSNSYCGNWTNRLEIDTKMEQILDSMIADSEVFILWGWLWWLVWFWGNDMHNYIIMIDEMLNCGINNRVTGSKYANYEYVDRVWSLGMTNLQEITSTIEIWSDPFLITWLLIPVPIFFFWPWTHSFVLIWNLATIFVY